MNAFNKIKEDQRFVLRVFKRFVQLTKWNGSTRLHHEDVKTYLACSCSPEIINPKYSAAGDVCLGALVTELEPGLVLTRSKDDALSAESVSSAKV